MSTRTFNQQPAASTGAPRITIRDVAEAAGVSIGTVSLALADNPLVAEATKARVHAVAAQLQYRPSAVGRALQARRTNAIGLIIPQTGQHVFSHLYFMEVLAGVSAVVNAANMTLVVSTAPEAAGEEAAYLKVLRSQQVDGVILASAALHDVHIPTLQHSGFPFVFIGHYPLDPSIPAVGIDDRGGAYRAVQHLLGHGHSRIAHISGPLAHLSAIDRQHGYYDALRMAGVTPAATYCYEGDYSEEAGRAGMATLLRLAEPPTAVFAASDETAVGAMAVLRAAGIRVGQQFPVVGFDDVVLARLMTPALTTIHQPMRQLGVEAAQRLLAVLAGDTLADPQVELPTTFVQRESCGCDAARDGARSANHGPRMVG
jgi:DNA-binding LacI/PurR family transcriptional regulator